MDTTKTDTSKTDTSKTDTAKTDTGRTAIPVLGEITNLYGTSVHYLNGNLFVEIASAFRNGATVRILDLQGREVLRQRIMHGIVMDVRTLAPGLYHVAVSDGKRTDVKRFKK